MHAPLGTAERQVPAALAARVAEVTGGQFLSPIATLNTERTVVALRGGDGRVVAEVADDLVTAQRLPAAGEPMRWREIEVEVRPPTRRCSGPPPRYCSRRAPGRPGTDPSSRACSQAEKALAGGR